MTAAIYDDIQRMLGYAFMRSAFEAGILAAILAGVTGYFVVLRGETFAAHTVSQAGFPGAALAVLIGWKPLVGFLLVCPLAAIIIALLPSRGGERDQSAATGTVLAGALALGFLFSFLSSRSLSGSIDLLFGSMLGVSQTQVAAEAVVVAGSLAALCLGGRRLLFSSVDPGVADAQGVGARGNSVFFLGIASIAIAASITVTGVLLIFALLVAPAAAAQRFTSRPAWGITLSVLIAVAVTIIAITGSYLSDDLPPGFLLTTVAFAIYLVARTPRARLWART